MFTSASDAQHAGAERVGMPQAKDVVWMKVLVAVASRHGSTREIAGAIADELRATGIEADASG